MKHPSPIISPTTDAIPLTIDSSCATASTTLPKSPKSPERRASGPKEKWARLDDLLNGPRYVNSPLWTLFPILKRRQPDAEHPGRKLRWVFDTCKDEVELVTQFFSQFRTLTRANHPDNSVQGESLYILMYIARILPFMSRATMDSNSDRMLELVEVVKDLLQLLGLLVEVDEEARDILNDQIDEELLQLKIRI